MIANIDVLPARIRDEFVKLNFEVIKPFVFLVRIDRGYAGMEYALIKMSFEDKILAWMSFVLDPRMLALSKRFNFDLEARSINNYLQILECE